MICAFTTGRAHSGKPFGGRASTTLRCWVCGCVRGCVRLVTAHMLLPPTNIVTSVGDDIVSSYHLVGSADQRFNLPPCASYRTSVAHHYWQLPHVLLLRLGYFATFTRTEHRPAATGLQQLVPQTTNACTAASAHRIRLLRQVDHGGLDLGHQQQAVADALGANAAVFEALEGEVVRPARWRRVHLCNSQPPVKQQLSRQSSDSVA